MPLVDFQCKDCGREFSVVQEPEEDSQTHLCPNCQSDHLERVEETREPVAADRSRS